MRFPNPVTLFRALVRWSRRHEIAPESAQIGRQNRCLVCPHYENGQCQVCTCYVPMKIILATESCPKGQWGEYFSDANTGLEYPKIPQQ